MEVIEQALSGVRLIQLKSFKDERGHFRECYKESLYQSLGIDCSFVQDNHSYSKGGVIRGLHFQPGQAKLLTVIAGTIFDVFVDIRPDSPTFGHWQGLQLDAEGDKQLFLPDGYAHGFAVLSEEAHLFYKVSKIYDPSSERALRYDDPEVGIDWPLDHPILSERDRHAFSLRQLRELIK